MRLLSYDQSFVLALAFTALFQGACDDGGEATGDAASGGLGSSDEVGGANAVGGASTGGSGDDSADGGQGSGAGPSSGGQGSGATSSGGAISGSGGDGLGGEPSSGGADLAGGAGGEATASGGAPDQPDVSWPLINGVQWADTDGNPIQAHGGGMLKVGEDYYWFGENRNPDGTFFAVSAYRSRDLRTWEHAGDVLSMDSDPGLKPANVERPKVVYNESTGKYVMWMHWENGEHYGEARAAVASSDTVDGDYTYHGSFRPYQDRGVTDHDRPGYMSRDCTLFVDDDGKAYFLSSSNENYDLHLYSLTDDYLSIDTREAVLFEGGHREAPALFKRNGTYFLVSSGSTGWSPNQGQYATSSSLTGGWSSLKNVADGNTFYSQSTYVQAVEGSSGTEYLYMGDRWAGAWSGRVNDSSYLWQPIEFPTDTSMTMGWFNTLQIDTQMGTVAGSVDSFAFVNKNSGLRLSIEGDATQDSADALQAPEGQGSQSWRLNYDAAGHFRITVASGSKVIDVPDESTQAGIALHLWSDTGGAHQAWYVQDLGQGDFKLRNKNSGLYIGVAGASLENSARVEQQSAGGDEQIWQIVALP